MIKDKYTDMPLSRQRKYQLRHVDKGLCIKCNDKAVTGGCCLKHAVQNREMVRSRMGHVKRFNGKTYRLEAQSTMPMIRVLTKSKPEVK